MNTVVDLACSQAEMGHTVAIASSGGDFVELVESRGVQHFKVEQFKKELNAFVGLNKVFASWKPDIVHGHMLTGFVVARVLQPLYRYRVVTTVHNEFKRSASWMGHANVMVAVSEENRQRLVDRGVPERRTTVVRNGVVGGARTLGRPSEPVSLQHPNIVAVAGLFDRKGVGEVIEAFGALDARYGAHLYIVGRGPERDKLEAQAKALPCADRIHFEGFKTNAKDYLKAADIFVLASHSDPFPLVIPEARAAGCAIVATRVGGITEGLENGARGILVEPKSPPELHAAFDLLLSDPAKLAHWRAQAAENLDWLTVRRMAVDYLNVYERARL
ncbi:MAG TPA: glycosyltransferase family 4 protein [Caulobacteraceae bacterium]|nr:glycosyltransferase family 4 protein [Caulobacteraceae bacterium]